MTRVKVTTTFEVDIDEDLLEQMNSDEGISPAAQAEEVKSFLEDDEEHLSILIYEKLKVLSVEVIDE